MKTNLHKPLSNQNNFREMINSQSKGNERFMCFCYLYDPKR